jgi:hypothetical protein
LPFGSRPDAGRFNEATAMSLATIEATIEALNKALAR